MKAILSFLLFTCMAGGCAQKTEKYMKTNEKDSIGRVERFDFEYAKKIEKEFFKRCLCVKNNGQSFILQRLSVAYG